MTQLSVAAFLSVSLLSFSRVWAHLQQDPKGNSMALMRSRPRYDKCCRMRKPLQAGLDGRVSVLRKSDFLSGGCFDG